MFKKVTLDNGLRVLTAPMQGTNTVTILVMCETGSDHDPDNELGISHFLEHMFFKGTSNRPTPQILAKELDSMGGYSNAFTSHEMTVYEIKVGKIYYQKALDIIADIYSNSLLNGEEIDRERQVILEERKFRYEDPGIYTGFLWEELVFGSRHGGFSSMGTEMMIRNLPAQSFREYFKTQYTAQNTIVVIAGNFDENRAVADVTRFFGAVRATTPRPPAPYAESQTKPQLKIDFREKGNQTHIALGFRGLDAHNPDRYVGDLLSTILGASFSSRMFDTLRERLGLAYTVYTDHTNYGNRGYLFTYAGVAHENVEKAIQAMTAEYRKILDAPVEGEELERAKNSLKGRMLIRLESSDAMASFVGVEEAQTKKPLTVEEVFAKIDAVTPQALQAFARYYFRPERLNLALIGPFREEETFQKLIADFH